MGMNFLTGPKTFFLILTLILIGVAASPAFAEENNSLIPMSINGKKILVEVVRTDREKEKGLMFRDKLAPHEGMLFVYGSEEILSFWMKNTRIPLSIAFIDRRGRIVDIQDMEPFSLAGHLSRFPAKYALEMNQGWFKRNGVGVGDTVKIPEADKKSGSRR
jgi:uncharacterized protein